jgi:hypothetical protein
MALLLARRRVDRSGAVPGREMPGGREAGDVRDVADEAGGTGWPIPLSCWSLLPVAATSSVSCALAALIFLSMPTNSLMSSEANWRRVRPTRSRGRTVLSRARACSADRNFFAPPGDSSRSSLWMRLTVSVRLRPRVSRRSTSSRSATVVSSAVTSRKPFVRNATTATLWASTGPVLRPCPVANTPAGRGRRATHPARPGAARGRTEPRPAAARRLLRAPAT